MAFHFGKWTVYLCRHGETDMNSSGKLQGKHSNPPLNGKGNAQADALGVALAERFQRQRQEFVLVNSPLLRAQQTAWHVARHCGSLCHWERANPMDEFKQNGKEMVLFPSGAGIAVEVENHIGDKVEYRILKFDEIIGIL